MHDCKHLLVVPHFEGAASGMALKPPCSDFLAHTKAGRAIGIAVLFIYLLKLLILSLLVGRFQYTHTHRERMGG